jgi:hypothetical protein
MKTKLAKGTWDFWKATRDEKFIKWFEQEMFGNDPAKWTQNADEVPEGIKSSIRK